LIFHFFFLLNIVEDELADFEIGFDIINNLLFVKKDPSKKLNQTNDHQKKKKKKIELINVRDRNYKILPTKFSTEKVNEKLMNYKDQVDSLKKTIKSSLQSLSQNLSQHLPILILSSHFSVVLQVLLILILD